MFCKYERNKTFSKKNMGKDLSLIFSDFASQDWPRWGGIGWGANGCLWASANMAHSGMGGLGKNLVSN